MKRKLLIGALAFGTLLGYGGCAARVVHQRAQHGAWGHRRASFEERVARICADAALRVRADAPANAPR
jgi:hypothetical protein